jgi:hypothetical protein
MKSPVILVFVALALIISSAHSVRCQSFSHGLEGLGPSAIGGPLTISQAQQNAGLSETQISDDLLPRETMATSPLMKIAYIPEFSLPAKDVYYTTIELARFSWPDETDKSDDDFGGKLTIGLNKPYYRLKKDIRVVGNFDFKIENIIMGLLSSAKITMKYDLQKRRAEKRSRVKLLMDKITFKIGIPFGLPEKNAHNDPNASL